MKNKKLLIGCIIAIILGIALARFLTPASASTLSFCPQNCIHPTPTPTMIPHCFDNYGDDNDHNPHCTPRPTVTPTPTPTPTPSPSPCLIWEGEFPLPCPSETPTPSVTPEPTGQPLSVAGGIGGWSAPACTAPIDAAKLQGFTKDKTTGDVTFSWWPSTDQSVDSQTIVFGYSPNALNMGQNNLPKDQSSFTIHGLAPGVVWAQIWSYSNGCSVKSNILDP